jgi:hypothetical protein
VRFFKVTIPNGLRVVGSSIANRLSAGPTPGNRNTKPGTVVMKRPVATSVSYRLEDEGKIFEYRMVLQTRDRENCERLSVHLCSPPQVLECKISPMGD